MNDNERLWGVPWNDDNIATEFQIQRFGKYYMERCENNY